MTLKYWFRVATGTLLCLAAACKDEGTSEFSVQVVAAPSLARDWSALTVEIAGPDVRRSFTRADFEPEHGTTNQFRGPAVLFRGAGTALATVRLPGDGAPRGAELDVSFAVEPNWGYGMVLRVGGGRPTGFFCSRLVGVAPLPSTPAESLYVLQGGIPKDAVC